MRSILNGAKPLGLVFVLSLGATASANPYFEGSRAVGKAQHTVIELSRNEALQMEFANGDAWDPYLAGGMIVVDGEMTEEQQRTYKAELLNPIETKVAPSEPSAQWCTGYYLSNIVYRGNNFYFLSRRLQAAEGRGPMTLTVTVSKTATATYSANVGVSASVVTAGVGYSFSTSYGVSASGTWAVPSGTYGRLEAYAMHNKHTWDVWDDDCGTPADTYKGAGSSFKPNGSVYFRRVTL